MHGQSTWEPHPNNLTHFSRPIESDRDYREAKSLLGLTMRAARDDETAIRAEALLRQIVEYEMRLDEEENGGWDLSGTDRDYEGPRRRWSDFRHC